MRSRLSGPEIDYPRESLIQQRFEAQAEKTPDAVALVFRDERWTFRRLNDAANRLAHHLIGLGVRPGELVGLCLDRSCEMVASQLAILKAGAGYVPLDPTYPVDRTQLMAEDAGIRFVVTVSAFAGRYDAPGRSAVALDQLAGAIEQRPTENPAPRVGAEDLCWVLYTSGSTGKPKGVMIRHRNVVNFLSAMDSHIPFDTESTWLAVTSISFDISVLEIYWPLTRGFKVVLWPGREVPESSAGGPAVPQAIDFSLFYFASATGDEVDPYRVLLEGARFADANGFSAIWTPERHFDQFGGIYPNPSVAAAAIATITQRVGIRAGSCVLPLHSPIRVAEEWSFVDRISGGRVGLSVAAGWNPDDFVLRPESYADRKERMFRDIETVRSLWRGEAVEFVNPLGKPVHVRTLPRPVQAELPVWITVAGNPETFRMAGERGYHVLTHLLGQTVDEVAARIAEYRKAWTDAGRPGNGRVSLMIHTYVGDDVDTVRETVREPMIAYLRSAFDLVRKAAWSFPTFRERSEKTGKSIPELLEERSLSAEEIESLLEFSFERYFETSGLFGTPESCLEMVRRLQSIGVDELACLIDFGVAQEQVIAALPDLDKLRRLAATAYDVPSESIADLIVRHEVTHLQCTPTMARLLAMDAKGLESLGGLDVLAVGGEALPPALASLLRRHLRGRMLNLYGPTETTVWSTVYPIETSGEEILIGRPLANTVVEVLSESMQPVGVGETGELYIGGDGVAKGYLNRPELTAERFVRNAAGGEADGLLYRTGDLVRMRADGNLEYFGRTDQQVKVRGFRVELGEIESILAAQPSVAEAVAVGRSGSMGEVQVVAFVVARPGSNLQTAGLRAALLALLPDFMIPSRIVQMAAFPQTPNRKTDRGALAAMPLPDGDAMSSASAEEACGERLGDKPAAEGEAKRNSGASDRSVERLTQIWVELLGRPEIGPRDNFFELGGNSLIAARMMSLVRERFGKRLPLTALLRAPTIEQLAEKVKA